MLFIAARTDNKCILFGLYNFAVFIRPVSIHACSYLIRGSYTVLEREESPTILLELAYHLTEILEYLVHLKLSLVLKKYFVRH